jgi:hypothetical protein
MGFKWSKIVLVSMLVLAMFASISFATTARVRSLANSGDYMSDDSNVNRWISTLPAYANQVGAEVGTYNGFGSLSDTRGLSWNFRAGDYGTYRITLNEHTIDSPGFWMINPFYSSFTPSNAGNLGGPGAPGYTPINTWDVAGGWEIGENHMIGVNFTRSRFSYESTGSPDTTISNSWTSLGLGYSFTNNEDLAIDAVANIGFAGGEWQFGPNATKFEYDAKSAFDIAGRVFWDWKDNITVPVIAEFISQDYSIKPPNQVGSGVPNGDKNTAFGLGAGVNMDVNQDHMLIFAAEYVYYKWEYSNPGGTTGADSLAEMTMQAFPTLRLALESSITSWLTTRVGAARHQTKVKYTSNTGKEIDITADDSPSNNVPIGGFAVPGWAGFSSGDFESFEWFLGLGFNVAEWTIDMELNHETPFSLGYWLTGYSGFFNGGPGPVYRISATYNY